LADSADEEREELIEWSSEEFDSQWFELLIRFYVSFRSAK